MQAKDIRFGIEIECYVPASKAEQYPAIAWHSLGHCQIPGLPAGWHGEVDGSLRHERHETHVPREIISPILHGEDGLTQAVFVVNKLQADGAIVNERCGLHVHVDARSLTPDQVEQVKAQFKRYEKAFFAVSGERAGLRWHSIYCSPSQGWSSDHNRYQSLNVANYGSSAKNTLEIRVWAGTLSDTEVVAAVSMAVALVVKACNEQLATDLPQIEEPRTAVWQFVKDHLHNPNNRIVPDAPIWDIVLRAHHQARKAARALS